jgi:hypothetical protein
MPLRPYWRNDQWLFMVLPLLLNCVGSTFIRNGRPCSFASSGLGSNESTCETPPSMNRKMTLRAFAG